MRERTKKTRKMTKAHRRTDVTKRKWDLLHSPTGDWEGEVPPTLKQPVVSVTWMWGVGVECGCGVWVYQWSVSYHSWKKQRIAASSPS
jgi:hypothetical protein